MVNCSFCSTSGTRRVNLVAHPMMSCLYRRQVGTCAKSTIDIKWWYILQNRVNILTITIAICTNIFFFYLLNTHDLSQFISPLTIAHGKASFWYCIYKFVCKSWSICSISLNCSCISTDKLDDDSKINILDYKRYIII